ncbi:hypothetical protein NDU88_008948 [Pleurodeles waltl]|uniref:Uncharacterized protein n=1 Tax=Pleurodeles waltl TaxID=8319 RepID=A0AAV7RTW5_PLEWA|nr:hypothetical protein NDU88_008948 [Pleurodeles waltl]
MLPVTSPFGWGLGPWVAQQGERGRGFVEISTGVPAPDLWDLGDSNTVVRSMIRRSRAVGRNIQAGEAGTSTQRFSGTGYARVRRRARKDAVWASEKLVTAASKTSPGGALKTRSAFVTPRHVRGGSRIEVRGEALSVPPCLRSLTWRGGPRACCPSPPVLFACSALQRLPSHCCPSSGVSRQPRIGLGGGRGSGCGTQGCPPHRGTLLEA